MWNNMFLNILLCCPFIVLISANIVPGQTYSVYQQNGYPNPSAYETSNIQSYIPTNTVQNEIYSTPISIRQALLNRLLTNPSGQTSFDPTIANYCTYLNGVENYQLPVNSVYNNYPITSITYLKNETDIKENSTDNKTLNSHKKSKRKRKSKKKSKNNEEYISSVDDRDSKTTKNGRKATKNSSKRPKQDDEEDNIENINKVNKRRRRKKKKKQQIEVNLPEAADEVKKSTERKRRKKHKKDTENSNDTNSEIMSKQIESNDNLDLVLLNEGSANENRLTRNSNLKRNDLMKSPSNSPKDVTEQFFNNLQTYSNPQMANWLNEYKHFFDLIQANQPTMVTSKKRFKKRKKGKKPKKTKKRKKTQTNNMIKASTAVNTNTDDEATTTERIMYLSEHTETNFNSDSTEKALLEDEIDTKYFSNEISNDGYNNDDYEEKYDTGYYEGYIDDYFPQFYDSAAYNANNKDFFLGNSDDNKYYYATDRNDINNVYMKNGFDDSKPIDYNYGQISYDETDTITLDSNNSDDNFEEEISFRSPPLLESPDFKSRKVDKSEIIPELHDYNNIKSNKVVSDKYSSYSRAKTPNFSGDKRNENVKQPNDIETVYAKSKVVSYGPGYNPEDSSSIATDGNGGKDVFKGNSYKDGGTTYVIAESLDSSEVY